MFLFCLFQRKLRGTLIAATILKAVAKLREEGQAKGREKRGKFFLFSPHSPSSILTCQSLPWNPFFVQDGRRRLVSWFALQNMPALQATIFVLQIIVSIKTSLQASPNRRACSQAT